MRLCKSLQISSAGGFPRLGEEGRHRTGEIDGKARVAQLDAHGVTSNMIVGIVRAVPNQRISRRLLAKETVGACTFNGAPRRPVRFYRLSAGR